MRGNRGARGLQPQPAASAGGGPDTPWTEDHDAAGKTLFGLRKLRGANGVGIAIEGNGIGEPATTTITWPSGTFASIGVVNGDVITVPGKSGGDWTITFGDGGGDQIPTSTTGANIVGFIGAGADVNGVHLSPVSGLTTLITQLSIGVYTETPTITGAGTLPLTAFSGGVDQVKAPIQIGQATNDGDVDIGRSGQTVVLTGSLSLNGNPIVPRSRVVGGANATGSTQSVTLPGAKVGDRVDCVANLTTNADESEAFESIITVAGHIQQTSTDLSMDKLLVTFLSLS